MSEQFVVDKVKITQVSYAEYTEYDFVEPATFFVMDAMQNYTFVHTSKREVAQRIVDKIYGTGMYVVKASKIQATKSKREGGGLSVYATATRARPSSRPPK